MNLEAFTDAASQELFTIGDTSVTPLRIGTILLVLLITTIISRSIQRFVLRTAHRRGVEDDGAIRVGLRLMHYTLLLIGIGVAMQVVGIRLSALFAAGAVLAVGIGFATQTIVQNFVSGIILLVERSIKPGDILELRGEVVKVVEMGIRRTIVRTVYDEDIIEPNSSLVQNAVKNLTYSDKLYRLHVPVGVTYSSNLDATMEALERAARDVSWAEKEPAPLVLLTGFGSSSVDFDVSIWIRSPWSLFLARSDLLMSIWRALHEADIVIAFPQLDLHLDDEAITAIGRRAA